MLLLHFHQQGNEGEMHVSPSYRRVDMSNFPNMFDFLCTKSRVTWGCVYDAVGLDDAKRKCDALPHCKSFVAFSKFPEVSSKFVGFFCFSFMPSSVTKNSFVYK